jgi:predicted small lipoprotein YifL
MKVKIFSLLAILFMALTFSFVGCGKGTAPPDEVQAPQYSAETLQDSIQTLNQVIYQLKIDYGEISTQNVQLVQDTMRLYNQVYSLELWQKSRALEKIKYYKNIAAKDNTQLKYLVGWINRALADEKLN